ncbi:hypothetical protein [Streptomyces sp. NPDC056132]|uniref:hypothetical protein n=1 Tax=Streptomyces sp. NPDC056132 TaxID=3345722 RepID=UPI0035D6514F
MIELLCGLVLIGWLAGAIILTAVRPRRIADDPLLRLQVLRVAVPLYLAVVIVFWPATVAVRAVVVLVNRNRP